MSTEAPDFDWNPRYAAYATAQGMDPATMLAVDEVLWPGGRMAGFLLWIAERWRAWRAESNYDGILWPEHHAAFDAWIGVPA